MHTHCVKEKPGLGTRGGFGQVGIGRQDDR